jgi:hypothetical protein
MHLKTHPMPARTQNVSQLVLPKALPFQRRHKMYLKLCCPNPSHATKCISTCVWPISSYASENTKCISALWGPGRISSELIMGFCNVKKWRPNYYWLLEITICKRLEMLRKQTALWIADKDIGYPCVSITHRLTHMRTNKICL